MAGALAGTLLIDIATDVAKLKQGFDTAQGAIRDFGTSIANMAKGLAAGFGVQQVIAFGEAIQKNIDAMADLADNLKIPVEDFQALQNAALLAGQSMEATGAAVGKFNIFIGKASEGSKDQIERLNDLGVKILDINGKLRPTGDLLQEVAQKIIAISDPARRAAAEVDVFGKTGQSVSKILEQWAKGTTALNKELSDLGLIHSPEVVKQMADMADKSDIAAKKVEVLFAPFYAIAKSAVLDVVASAMERFTNAIKGVAAGDADTILKVLQALALVGTGNVGGAVSVFAGIPNEIDNIKNQITATQKEIDRLNDGLVQAKQGAQGAITSAVIAKANEVAIAEEKLRNLNAALTQRTTPQQYTGEGSTGTGNPAIKTTGSTGVDKYAEAMRKLKEETELTQKAIEEFNKLTAAGTGGKEAQRQAKLLEDIGRARAKVITDIPKGVDPKPLQDMAEALVKLKFELSELIRMQAIADEVHKAFGDGTRELKDRLEDLNKSYRDGKISAEEYKLAVKAAGEAQEEQARQAAKARGGMDGFAAGMGDAMKQIDEATSTFAMGQNLIMGSWQIMSEAISEFVQTGEVNFQKLAASFAKMLADMAAKWAAAQILKGILSAVGVGASAVGGVGATSAAPAATRSGMFAGGGDVMPGRAYTIGERGPETFVPSVAGRIEPHGGSSNVTVNVDMGATQGASDPSSALAFGRKIKAAVVDVIANEKRPGGTLYRAA